MRTLARIALQIFSSLGGIGPVMMVDMGLPGAAQATQEILNELWGAPSQADFGDPANAIEAAKKQNNWEQVIGFILELLQKESVQSFNRLNLLIDLAIASHCLNNKEWIKAALEEADVIMQVESIDDPRYLHRMKLAKTALL